MSYLDRIFATKRDEVARAKLEVPVEGLRESGETQAAPRGFRRALQSSPFELSLIAEVKAASPSQGAIRDDLDPAEVARDYEAAGAQCLSVLTDEPYFKGSLDNLRLAHAEVQLPILRKDFILDPYQIVESRAWGADAVLLIVAGLEEGQLADLQAQAWGLGMDVLVEVHSRDEVEVALRIGANLIGVNNRNLSTFETDLGVSESLIPLISPHALAVSESALGTRADLDRVQAAGARAVLIGTTFCAAPDIRSKVREVMGR